MERSRLLSNIPVKLHALTKTSQGVLPSRGGGCWLCLANVGVMT